MNRLVAYESDEESPERRRSREDIYKSTADSGEVSTSGVKKPLPHKIRKSSDRWTASDEEIEGSSGESTSGSSGRQSSSAGEQPPPPKRFSPFHSERSLHSDVGSMSLKQNQSTGLMPINQSQTSLVSYDGQEEEDDDQFAKADKKAAAEWKSHISPPRSRSVTVEPKPPRGHEDSRSPDEIAVDSALEEGLRELREHVRSGESAAGSPSTSYAEGHESPLNLEESAEVTLPPSPTEKCSRELELKFEKFFAKKAAGMDLNSSIQTRRDFKNPSIYEVLIDSFKVDELGSNFDPSVFDPHGFTEDCFYDAISAMQKEVMEKYTANAEKKASGSTADTSKANDVKRKSRFEGTKKH